MSGLNMYDKKKLLHDIKRLSKEIKILAEENNTKKRMRIYDLMEDEMARLLLDIEEMTEK